MAGTLSAALSEGVEPSQITNLLNQNVAQPEALVPIPEDAIQRTAPGQLRRPTVVSALAGEKIEGLSLKPTVVLQQKYRYLQLLNELRRMNEGDDTADAPGYSLNIVRIPVSVMPGHCTRQGFGAEITVTARSYMTPDLLPLTFRGLVINDVVDRSRSEDTDHRP